MPDNETNTYFPEESENTTPDEDFALAQEEGEGAPAIGEEEVAADEESAEPEKEESRSRRAFRKFIRWTVGLLIVFGLGFLAAIFTIYNQKVIESDRFRGDLSSAETTITELEDQIAAQQNQINSLNAQIDSLNQEIMDLETQNEELISEQDSYNLQIALLKARADVISAQLRLQEGNPTQARVLMQSAKQTLTTIETLLPEDLKDIIAPLQSRLELAIGGIEEDPETSMTDLGKIAGDLHEIENARVWE